MLDKFPSSFPGLSPNFAPGKGRENPGKEIDYFLCSSFFEPLSQSLVFSVKGKRVAAECY